MLSHRAVKFLKWLAKNDEWLYQSQIENYPGYNYRTFNALVNDLYIDHITVDTDIPSFDENEDIVFPIQYRINDKGLAYLELVTDGLWKEIRAWVTLGIACASLVLAIISLLQQ